MSESKANKPVPEKATAKDTSRTPALAADKQKPAKPAPAKKREPGGSNSALWLSLLSLAASIALGVAAFFFWNQQQQFLQGKNTVEKRVENKLQEVDAAISRVKTDFDDLKTGDLKNRGELTDKFAQFNETQRAQSDRINKLNSLVGRSTQDWAMAEVEYLLRLASDRVQLQRDVKTALVALNNADQRLLEISDPGLSKVRQQIADEIDQLKRVPVIDREGFAASLSALLARLDRLPLDRQVYQAVAAEQAGNDASEKAIQDQPVKLDWKSWQDWQKIPAMIGEALRKLVTIREHDQPVQPMMQPGSEIFLRQNLRLQIEAARLALLREDAVFYKLKSIDDPCKVKGCFPGPTEGAIHGRF